MQNYHVGCYITSEQLQFTTSHFFLITTNPCSINGYSLDLRILTNLFPIWHLIPFFAWHRTAQQKMFSNTEKLFSVLLAPKWDMMWLVNKFEIVWNSCGLRTNNSWISTHHMLSRQYAFKILQMNANGNTFVLSPILTWAQYQSQMSSTRLARGARAI